jgi:hypothetical protein
MKTHGITPQGISFLKCAFAAPDFDGTSVYGVPDDFGGKSLAIKHRTVIPVTFAANNDVYFMQAPVPGIAYYTCVKPAGTALVAGDTWTPLSYPNFTNIFSTNTTGNSLTQKFRIVSNHFELVCATNNNNWTGNVQAFKIPVQMYEAQAAAAPFSNYFSMSGVGGINAADVDMYVGPFNLGTYAGAFNRGANFEFNPVLRDQVNLPIAPGPGDFTQLLGLVPGFDNNMETLVIKVSGVGVNPNNSAIIKAWSCVEYQFTPGTVMYESQILHCNPDPVALEIYKKLSLELPVGVSYLDNANFWERVLKVLASLGMSLSSLPGPYGMVAGGVGTIATGIRDIAF